MALQGRAYKTYQKVCELRDHPGTPRHERQAAADAAARMEQKYGFTPIRPSQPPPEPPKSRQNGRADSGRNHKQQREKPRTGANSRQSGPSGRQTWQAEAEQPRSRQEQRRQEEWQAKQREKAQQEEWERFYEDVDRAARDNRKAQEDLDEMLRRWQEDSRRFREEDERHQREWGRKQRPGAWKQHIYDEDQFDFEAYYQDNKDVSRAQVEWMRWTRDNPYATTEQRQAKWRELWPPVGPTWGRPSTARAEQYPDSSSMDIAAVLLLAASIMAFLSMAVLAAMGGWFGIKQFLVIAGLFALAGVLLVNIVME